VLKSERDRRYREHRKVGQSAITVLSLAFVQPASKAIGVDQRMNPARTDGW
jgi:hypothetical protein